MRRLFFVLILAFAASASAAVKPGDFVPGFGSNDFVRINFPGHGGSNFDSARAVKVRYESSPPLNISFPYIYVAGIAGDRVAIAKLNANGTLVNSFGSGGIATGTQQFVGNFAGLEFAPNGDLVVGYSGRYMDLYGLHMDGDEFFIEVFDRNGQPRTQQSAYIPLFGDFVNVNWVGVDVKHYDQSHALCKSEIFTLTSTAYSMAVSPGGNLALVGIAEGQVTPEGAEDGYKSYIEQATARFWFDQAAGVYRRAPQSNVAANNSCAGLDYWGLGGGAYKYFYVHGDWTTTLENSNNLSHAAAWLTDDDLRIAGPVIDEFYQSGLDRNHWYGGYHALPSELNAGGSDASGSAWMQGGYWGMDVRNSEFNAMQWVPALPRLFLYGNAENEFYAGGNKNAPVIGFDSGSNAVAARWAFLNSSMSAVYSARTSHGIHRNGKHILLGPLRLCGTINDCTGEWNGFFVSRTSGAPDGLAYAPDTGFADNGSRYYNVRGNNGIPAQRSWAWQGAVLQSNLVVPGEESWSDLIVVGDFRYAESSDETDYDWFITRIRLRGSNGGPNVSLNGTGTGSVTSAPAGINCPGTCAATFTADTQVVLTATPAPGSSFAGWAAGSACESISGAQCTVWVDGEKNVTATFQLQGAGSGIFSDGFE